MIYQVHHVCSRNSHTPLRKAEGKEQPLVVEVGFCLKLSSAHDIFGGRGHPIEKIMKATVGTLRGHIPQCDQTPPPYPYRSLMKLSSFYREEKVTTCKKGRKRGLAQLPTYKSLCSAHYSHQKTSNSKEDIRQLVRGPCATDTELAYPTPIQACGNHHFQFIVFP